MCLCVYVCVHVCVHACTHVCLHACACMHMCVCMHACVCCGCCSCCVCTLCKLYPDSKMIGGSSTMKKTVGGKASSFCKSVNQSISVVIHPNG